MVSTLSIPNLFVCGRLKLEANWQIINDHYTFITLYRWHQWTILFVSGVQSAGWLGMTHTSHKDTEQSTIEASITLNDVTLTDSLIRLWPNEWHSVCQEIPVSSDKMFWTANKPARWTLYIISYNSLTLTILFCKFEAAREMYGYRKLTNEAELSRTFRTVNRM
jgi:hypothetical protein